ncbi:MAG: agmatine deiminase family protein, partial [Ignavibacteria bacterium]|nr:agmatine deiminase family protein [Ignavibacteria bacterium]
GKTEAQIDTIMKKYMGLHTYIKMNTLPYDVIHHIDMHIKLLDEETLMVGQYPPGVADGPQIEANLQYILNNFQTCYGRPFKVVRILMPPENGQYPPSGDYRTYTNSIIINKTVIIPIYEYQFDTTAFRIYREAMPGYNIVGINSNSIIPSLGAIHCIVKEIGVKDPIFISHSALRDTNNTATPYEVKAYIKTKSGISNAKVYWTTDTTQGFSSLNMTASADTFTAYIPNKPLGTTIYYYISATSNNSKTISKPLPAPSGNFRFRIENSSGITGNNSLVKKYTLYQNYPNPFNPATKIKFDLPKNGFVRIQVFDVAGRLVHTLINDFKFRGSYEINFDGSNLTSGVYFYKMETVDYNDVKKMLLLK